MNQNRDSRRPPSMTLRITTILVLSFIASWACADAETRPLIVNTVIFAGGGAILALPMGLITALYLHRARGLGHRLVLAIMATLLFLPAYLHVAGWEAGFGMQGWFCRWCFPDEPFALLSGWSGALWVQCFVNLPWIVLILSIGLSSISNHQQDLARLDGNELRVLTAVVLPQLKPAIAAALLWCFVMAAGEITITDVYRVRTFAEELYMGFALGDALDAAPKRNLPGSLLILGIASSALLACLQVSRNLQTVSAKTATTNSRVSRLVAAPVIAFALLAIIVPILNLMSQAGLEVVADGDARIRQWSLAKACSMIADLFSYPFSFGEEFAWSFVLGQLTAITVVAFAFAAALLAKSYDWARATFWIVTVVGLSIPGPITALAIGRLVNQPSSDLLSYLYDRTLFVPWLALSIKLFPYAFLVSTWTVARINKRPIELIELDTANLRHRLRHGWLPQLWHPLAWLWMLILALSIADLSATILAVPPGVTTVAIRIFNLVHYGVGDQLAALCLGTMAIFGGFSLAISKLLPTHFD